MPDKMTNTRDRPREKSPTGWELQFCNLYVSGELKYVGRPKECSMEVFGEDTVKNPCASTNYPMDRPYMLAHVKALFSLERLEMRTMAMKLQVAKTLKVVMDGTTTPDYTDRLGVSFSPTPLRAVSVNATKVLMNIFPIRHKEENCLRIEGSDGNIIFDVIVPQNPMTDGEKET